MRLLVVTGSRDWTAMRAIKQAFDDFVPTVVMHGAATGADSRADDLAEFRRIPRLPMPAQWKTLVNLAGPTRNGLMVNVACALKACGWTVRIAAFPLGGPGTNDMVMKSRSAKLEVRIYDVDGGIVGSVL